MSSPDDSPRATVHAISDRAGDRVVYGIACTELVTMLRGAARGDSDPRLAGALEAIRREWLGIARARFPRLGEDAQDAAQIALVKLLSPDKIDSLSDPSLVDRWARSLFVNTVLDVLRDSQRRNRRLVASQDADNADADDLLARLPSREPDPEDQMLRSERLDILRRALTQ